MTCSWVHTPSTCRPGVECGKTFCTLQCTHHYTQTAFRSHSYAIFVFRMNYAKVKTKPCGKMKVNEEERELRQHGTTTWTTNKTKRMPNFLLTYHDHNVARLAQIHHWNCRPWAQCVYTLHCINVRFNVVFRTSTKFKRLSGHIRRRIYTLIAFIVDFAFRINLHASTWKTKVKKMLICRYRFGHGPRPNVVSLSLRNGCPKNGVIYSNFILWFEYVLYLCFLSCVCGHGHKTRKKNEERKSWRTTNSLVFIFSLVWTRKIHRNGQCVVYINDNNTMSTILFSF